MSDSLELTNKQRKMMRDFYEKPNVKVSLDILERKTIWNDFVSNRNLENISHLQKQVPSLYEEMYKAINQDKNIQPAVFSECVYAQDLAKKLDLSTFKNHFENSKLRIEMKNQNSEKLNELNVRYSYSSSDGNKVLYQAGGANAVDCVLHLKNEDDLMWIEMKEPYARTSEPDLPKYAEDGYIISSSKFEKTYPQFRSMLEEQIEKKLNVFEQVGHNISEFSLSSIETAVTENYSGKKYADVICTEDENGILVMLPSNHVAMWSKLEGEIRPSGRNSYKVWTPLRLMGLLEKLDAIIENDIVSMPLANLKKANARGGKSLSRYKISPFFFVRHNKVEVSGQMAIFPLIEIKQLNPSITAKMNFKGLNVSNVQAFYAEAI